MIILGVHDGHDSGAVLFKGEEIYAVNEERLNRIKKYRGFPELSIREVLKRGNANPEEVDVIAV
ncbi:MAG TPA: carbamoyl transferase, partial [Thermococcaceae archaeon]|nr:carbamoyl transferase [Thermococcaceae archaeon]